MSAPPDPETGLGRLRQMPELCTTLAQGQCGAGHPCSKRLANAQLAACRLTVGLRPESTWRVAADGVLVVVDLNREDWRSVTDDAAGVVSDLVELRPDLLARIPIVPYRDSSESWDTLCTDGKGSLTGVKHMGALSEAEAVAWVLALHG